MDIVVTGCSGFLGINLVRRLLKQTPRNRTVQIYGIDLRKPTDKEIHDNIEDLDAMCRFQFIEGDITEKLEIPRSFTVFGTPGEFVPDRIYHLACPASPPKYQKIPIKTLLTSVLGTYNVLEAASKFGARVLFSSTSEIYGDPLVHPQPETYLGNVSSTGPRACYDEGKRAAEALMYDFQRVASADIRVARIFNTYGPHMGLDDGRVVTNFVKQALMNEALTIYGDGSQTRSLCYVDDMIDGLIKLMESDYSKTPVNLGNPVEITIKQLAQEVMELTGLTNQGRSVNKELPVDDPRQRCPDISLARKVLDWSPHISRREGLTETINYAKEKLGIE